jgi:hypothetical protein
MTAISVKSKIQRKTEKKGQRLIHHNRLSSKFKQNEKDETNEKSGRLIWDGAETGMA